MEDELDTSWINELENIEKENDIFYKEPINFITVCFLYIHNKDLKKIKKKIIDLEFPGKLDKETLINVISENKLCNDTKYSLSTILKFNINIEPEHIKNFVMDDDTLPNDENIFSKIKIIDDIMWDDSITMFESLNTLFLIYNIKNASSAHTKRVMLKQNTTRKKKII